MNFARKYHILIVPALAFLFLFGCWEVLSRMYHNLQFVLPPPSGIVSCLWERRDRFLFHTLATLKEMGGGFLIAFLIAFPMAWLMTLYASSRVVLQPIFVVIQCIPMFTLAPIMVLWFDWSYTAIVIPIALMIFFPLTMNIYHGLRSTPQHLVDYFRVNEATVWQLFAKLQLPWALPNIFAGIRISTAIAGIGAVAGEWAGAQSGLGLLMLESRRAADLEMTFGALFCLTIVSMSLYVSMILLEKRVLMRRAIGVSFRPVAAVASLVFLALLLFGCQQIDSPKKEVRLILDWLPNPNHVPLYVGLERGFFEKQGIPLVIKKIHDPGDAVAYLTSGQTEVAVGYVPHTIRAMERGAKVVPIAILVKQSLNCILFRKDSGIEKPQDLSGKVIGYSIDGFESGYCQTVLKLNGVVPKRRENVSFDLVSTLGSKKVDAIFGAYWNIETEQLRAHNIETGYFDVKSLGTPAHYELIVVAGCEVSLDFVESFQRAMQESIDYSRQNPEEAFDAYLRANPDKREKTSCWERAAWLNTLPALADSQQIDPTLWAETRQWLETHKLL